MGALTAAALRAVVVADLPGGAALVGGCTWACATVLHTSDIEARRSLPIGGVSRNRWRGAGTVENSAPMKTTSWPPAMLPCRRTGYMSFNYMRPDTGILASNCLT